MQPTSPVSPEDPLATDWVCSRAGQRGPGLALMWTIIPAAGQGLRAGAGLPKQYRSIQGRPMLQRSLDALRPLEQRADFGGHLVMLSPADQHWAACGIAAPHVLACRGGGASRGATVLNGLRLLRSCLGAAGANDWILVHDAARPWLSAQDLERLVSSVLAQGQGGLLATPVPDTVKRVKASGAGQVSVEATLSRDGLWLAQTPQMFKLNALIEALEARPDATDESSAMEAMGAQPLVVLGAAGNRKMTFTEDFHDMAQTGSSSRIGQGFDVHALVEGRPLILGGVLIPHSRGLLGHSDADVLLHAISDAVLGAACLGDIGRHFPDTDAAYAGADSRVLLRDVVARAAALGLRVGQVDATVVAQAPKLSAFIDQMVRNIRADTGAEWVNVKATTTESLGFTGRQEGIAAQAIVMLEAMGAS
jgi:2-C-methyl-D-erythritol 4-phosphate cytidylyltransferase / 2-C-methyl-D-erythritol 2,4-cyclodiphosphate synthase